MIRRGLLHDGWPVPYLPAVFHRPLVVVEPGNGAPRALAAAREVAAPCAVYDLVCVHPGPGMWILGLGIGCVPVCAPVDWDQECLATLGALVRDLPQDVCVRTTVLGGDVRARLRTHVSAGTHDVIILGTRRPIVRRPTALADRARRQLMRLTAAPVLAPA